MKKRVPRGLCPAFSSHTTLLVYPCVRVRSARRSLTSGASRPSERGGARSPSCHHSAYALPPHFPLPNKEVNTHIAKVII